MVQTLEVISVNLWDIIISLANLLLLYLGLKKFLFAPVKNILAKRESEIESRYESAREAEEAAKISREKWETQLSNAKSEADSIIKNSTESAKNRYDRIVEEATKRGESIVKKAENDAELEYRKSAEKIKEEIVELSGVLAEKMLEREISRDDHRNLIDAFIEKIGDDNDRNQ